MIEKATQREQLYSRLRRVEGQVRGLQRMLAENRGCAEVLTQLSAARNALDEVGKILLDGEIERCLDESSDTQARESLQQALRMWARIS
jgi:DNA-binding FrmR family transcriptional regulator